MAGINNPTEKCIQRLLNITEKMIDLADQGDSLRDDVGCGILFGIVRDCAYKIRSLAQSEMLAHKSITPRNPLPDQPLVRETSQIKQQH